MTRYFVTYTGYASNLVGTSPAGFPGSTFVDREAPIESDKDIGPKADPKSYLEWVKETSR